MQLKWVFLGEEPVLMTAMGSNIAGQYKSGANWSVSHYDVISNVKTDTSAGIISFDYDHKNGYLFWTSYLGQDEVILMYVVI